ncbi:MAG: ABC transporter permease [Bacteroides sp.]|nr:ABC transporter permease [Bacteroides sp.]
MYKIYFRQAIQLLLQNKLMSIIAILGTALAITMIMTIIVTEEIKNINVPPEVHRDRTLYIPYQITRNSSGGGQNSGYLTYETVHQYLKRLEQPEYVSAVNQHVEEFNINPEGVDEDIEATVRITDAAYWKILSFTFIQGRPFTEEEFQSGMPYAVITESTARKLFKDEDTLGKSIEIDYTPFRIIGIVKDVSQVFKHAYGNVWIPYTSSDDYKELPYGIMLLARDSKEFDVISQEVRDLEKKYKIENSGNQLFLKGPENNQVYNMDMWAENVDEMETNITLQKRKKIFIFIILLLIPALNLSGISLSRIKKRIAEIGVRKAFGAKKYVILIQVLYENLITSLIGGLIGLLLSYGIIFWLREWLLRVPENTLIPLNTLVSPLIFLTVFVICVLMNLLSAGLPAWKASRLVIINSINQNEKTT